jgi:hypothetical protein
MFGCFCCAKEVHPVTPVQNHTAYYDSTGFLRELKSELAIAQRELCAIKYELINYSTAPQLPPSSLLEKVEMIKSQIEVRSHRRDESNLRKVFDDVKIPSEEELRREKLATACNAAGMDNTDETTIDELLYKLNLKSAEALNFEEFSALISEPSELESVMKTIPFHQIFADAVPRHTGISPMKIFAELNPADIDVIVEASFASIKQLLLDQSSRMKLVQHRLAQDANELKSGTSKFACSIMNSGKIDDFHEGLGSRVGCNSRIQTSVLLVLVT